MDDRGRKTTQPEEASMALSHEGEEYFAAGRIDEARKAFVQALDIDPGNVSALNNLGVLLWSRGDEAKAIESFERALKIAPDNEDALYNLRVIHEALRDALDPRGMEPAGTPDRPDDAYLQVNIRGGLRVCVPPSIKLMTPYILLEQEDWFEEEIHYVRKALKQGMHVLDIGANYGLYTLTMASLLGPAGRLWAFEPTSATAAFLRKSIEANDLANVTLVQAGLSDKKGKATISLNADPELNAVTAEPAPGGMYETIELMSLDDCEHTYGWKDIAFIKLDAEGQEHNIVMGGKHFLSTQSPLILFEHMHVNKLNTQLIDDFLALGYQLYYLIPGLRLLAPIQGNRSFDPYQLNLFCCKPDRARLLEDQGLLITTPSPPDPVSDASLWKKYLQAMPYHQAHRGSFASGEQEQGSPGWDHYETALNCYVMAHDESKPAHSRYAHLLEAGEEMEQALKRHVTLPRLMTQARTLSELGRRGDSLAATEAAIQLINSDKDVPFTEPFIPASPRFDIIAPKELNKWVISSLLEYREKAKAFSSYYTGNSSLNNLEIMKTFGCQTPEMERRRQLIQMRFGLQAEPFADPLLAAETEDNLNPELWSEAGALSARPSLLSWGNISHRVKSAKGKPGPLLSICIPTYNRADILKETLIHLEHACGDDIEIVISDNCSPDHTQEVIEAFRSRFRHFRTIRQPENRGALKNIAAVMLMAGGKYCYTLCDDDRINAGGLQAALSILEENPLTVGVYGGYQEWDRASGKITSTISMVNQRTDFMQGDKLKVFNRFPLLWFPVCRTDILQRFSAYDQKSFGMWELAGTLLEHGGISTIPDVFYKHVHTIPRMEYEMTESWYHDAHRAQYECFAGRLGSLNFTELSALVTRHAASAYQRGAHFADIKKDPLTSRHFLLRSRAYGLVPEEKVLEWERDNLVGMVAERLLGHVELIPGIEEVIFEDAHHLGVVREHFSGIAQGYAVGTITQAEWQRSGLRPNQFLVTNSYGSPGWEEAEKLGPARFRAVQDIIETCRITDQPLDLCVGTIKQ